MKSRSDLYSRSLRSSRRRALAWLTLLLGAARAFAADESTAGQKTHTLFMGADLAIEHEARLHPVTDVVGTNLIVEVAGKRVAVRQSKEKALRINESLKIAGSRVSIGELKVERAYTPENDPFNKFVNEAGAAAGMAAEQSLAEARLGMAERDSIGAPGGPQQFPELEAAVNAAAYSTGYSQASNIGGHAAKLGMDQAQELFDAIRAYIEIIPERSMARPFFVLIAQFREKDSKPNTAQKWVYTKSLDALEAGVPRKVYLLQGGFPPGFHLENYSLHLYDEGQEVATNVSRKRVEITADEAYDFRVIEYMGANKGRTMPAALISTSVSGPMRNRLRALVNSGVYVRVMKDGKVGGGFDDPAGKHPLADAEVQAALKNLRFMPALQAGRPVEEIALLKWSDTSF